MLGVTTERVVLSFNRERNRESIIRGPVGLEGPMEWKVTTWANAATVSRLIQSARSSVVGQFLHLWISVPVQANGLCCASFHIWAEACTAALHDSQVKTLKCGRRRATIHQYNFFFAMVCVFFRVYFLPV